jgi:hypothetical protein
LAFLPYIDQQFAHEQYVLFRKNWFVHFVGMLGINEWFHAQPHPTDFPTGPVAFGMGEAATGIGIGACRANGDYQSWHAILRALNTLAVPQWTPTGERSFFFGQVLLADALAVWGETARRWDGDSPAPVDYGGGEGEPAENSYLAVCAAVALCGAAIVWLLGRHTFKLFSDKTRVRIGWQPATRIAFGCQLLAVVAFFSTTLFSWPQLFIYMLIVDRLEEMTLRPRLLAERLYNDAGR